MKSPGPGPCGHACSPPRRGASAVSLAVMRRWSIFSLALEQAAAGHGQVAAIVGEPGVGKSRLFYEFVHSHRTRGWLVLEAGSFSYTKDAVYFPVISLLKAYFNIQGTDDHREIRETGKRQTSGPRPGPGGDADRPSGPLRCPGRRICMAIL